MAFSEVTKALKAILVVALVVVVLFLVSSYVFAMFLGPTLFFFTPEGSAISRLQIQYPLYVQLFILLIFILPITPTYGTVFLFLCCVFVLCFAAGYKFRESLSGVIRKCPLRSIGSLFNNWLFAMPVVTSMLLIAVITIQAFQEAHGLPTGEPTLPPNPFKAFFLISYAPLFEEIGFRVSPIGAFLIVYLFWVRRNSASMWSWGQRLKLFFLSLIYPDGAKKMVGTKTVSDFGVIGGISLGEWGMVIFTSVTFGLAHYLFGGGWEVGKITTASMVGFAMGLAYLLYGVQAPILIHWFFNYYGSVIELASDFYPIVDPFFSITLDITTILGVFGWFTVTIFGLYKLFRTIVRRIRPSEPLAI